MFTILFLIGLGLAGWILYADRALLLSDLKKDFPKIEAAVDKLDVAVKAEVSAAVAEIKRYL
jgi:hypothetical protein